MELILVFTLVFVLHSASSVPTMLPLYKLPVQKTHDSVSLQARDAIRHDYLFRKTTNFTLKGSANPFLSGLYYTRIILGTPAREYTVQIDTGSDVTWLECIPCHDCPESKLSGAYRNPFDMTLSSTASFVSCPKNPNCSTGVTPTMSGCSVDSRRCRYQLAYEDCTTTRGYFVADTMNYSAVLANTTTNSSAHITFGCSFHQFGFENEEVQNIDGLMGLGTESISINSQLAQQGIIPNVLSHCLRGDTTGGGTLVLGEISESSITYTPLNTSWSNYVIAMETIMINGSMLALGSVPVLVDCGSTLSYLMPAIYDPFIKIISSVIMKNATYFPYENQRCYSMNSYSAMITEIFPILHLNFAGGLSMVLHPPDYMTELFSSNISSEWCLGFQRAHDDAVVSILGDSILKDRIVVYDLSHKRIGLANYNCSLPLNITTTSGSNVLGNLWYFNVLIRLLLFSLFSDNRVFF